MNADETVKLLGRIKGAWSKQATDDITIGVWVEALAGITYEPAQVAVVELIMTARADPPTPGQVKELALAVGKRLEDRERANRRALPAPPRGEREVSSVRTLCDDFFARHPGAAAQEREQRHTGPQGNLAVVLDAPEPSREPGEEG